MKLFRCPYRIDAHLHHLTVYGPCSIHCFCPCCYDDYYDCYDGDLVYVAVDDTFRSFDFGDCDYGTSYDRPY